MSIPASSIWWKIGDSARLQNRLVKIIAFASVEDVMVSDLETKAIEQVSIAALEIATDSKLSRKKLGQIPEEAGDSSTKSSGTVVRTGEVTPEDWTLAKSRFAAIEPLLKAGRQRSQIVKDRADEIGVHFTTLYRWLTTYERDPDLSSLLPMKAYRLPITKRIDPAVEAIVTAAIRQVYLKENGASMRALNQEIKEKCETAQLPAPSRYTVRRRSLEVSLYDRTKVREGANAALKFDTVKGSLLGAEYPWAVVQMDHLLLNIEVVDDDGLPVGRPWVTLAIETFSRMILGYSLDFEKPSAFAVGTCLINAMLPKESLIQRFGVRGRWPCWGRPEILHVDNANEFHGEMLTQACKDYRIELRFRPVRKPQYGGHIERYARTLKSYLTDVRGGTKNNDSRKIGGQNAEKQAALTLSDLEEWLVTYIVEVYHNAKHEGLGASPLKVFEGALLGKPVKTELLIAKSTLPRGVPNRVLPEEAMTLRLNFLPFIKRTIQSKGVRFENIYFYHDVLRRFRREGKTDSSEKLVFRNDPREVTLLYFQDPKSKVWYTIPTATPGRLPTSLWDYRAFKERLKSEEKPYDEEAVFRGMKRMREIERRAVQQTTSKKRTRKAAQKRATNKANMDFEQKQGLLPMTPQAKLKQPDVLRSSVWENEVEAFEHIEVSTVSSFRSRDSRRKI